MKEDQMKTENDRLAGAREQGQAQYDSIREMVERLRVAQEQAKTGPDETDAAERWIHEDALSVEVRSDWHAPGDREGSTPVQFRILLCTGGPAVQIMGELNEHCEPKRAWLQVQDWGTPWTDFFPEGDDIGEMLLAYARCFYFGE